MADKVRTERTEKMLGYAYATTSLQISEQVKRLKAAGCSEVLTDTKQGGRTSLEIVLSRLEAGDTLKVCAANRLSRSITDMSSIMKTVKGKGAKVESLDGLDMSVDFQNMNFMYQHTKENFPEACPSEEEFMGKVLTAFQEGDDSGGGIPYETFDNEIIELCRLVNEFPGIETTESCQGYINNHRDGLSWRVYFSPLKDSGITTEAYRSIEFLVWILNSGEAKAAGFDVALRMNSFVPAPNDPGQALYFIIEGWNRHPDELAQLIREMREKFFIME